MNSSENRPAGSAAALNFGAGVATALWCAWLAVRLARHWHGPRLEGDRLLAEAAAPLKALASAATFAGLANAALFLCVAALFLFAVASFGVIATAKFGLTFHSRAERLCFSFMIGAGFWLLSVALFNGQGFIRPKIWLIILIVIAIAALPRWFEILKSGARRANGAGKGVSGWLIAAFVAAAVFPLIGNMAPPTDVDSLMYHLQLPRLYLKHGGFEYLPWALHGNWPQNMEMLYELGMGLRGDRLARILHFAMGLATAGSVCAFGARYFTRQVGALAALLFLSAPVASFELATSYNELGLAFFMFMALYGFANRLATGKAGWLWLSALSAGMACGVKFTGALAVILIAAGWAALALTGRNKKGLAVPGWKEAAQFISLAAVLALIWPVRSFINTGNPIWPFAWEIFGGRNWSALNARDYAWYLRTFHGEHTLANLLRFPARSAFSLWEDSLGFLLLGAIPLLPLFRVGPRRLLWLAGWCGTFFLAWFFLSQQTRFLLPGLAVWALCVAWALDRAEGRPKRLMAAVGVVAFLTLVWFQAVRAMPAYGVVLGGEPRQEYLQRFGFYRAAQYINENAPADGKVLLLWDSRGYYIDRDVIWGDPMDQGFLRYWEFKSSGELMDRLEKLGVTHVLFHMTGLQNKVKFDKRLREDLGLSYGQPSVVASVVRFQGELLNNGAWQIVYTDENNEYYVLKAVY